MAQPSGSGTPSASDDVQRVREQLAQRLQARSVSVHDQDTSDELGTLTEAVEAFEAAVEARGGDLMVDEPPAGHSAQPDNPQFVMPSRGPNETAQAFTSRIDASAARLRA